MDPLVNDMKAVAVSFTKGVQKRRVFIGSSQEGLDRAKQTCQILSNDSISAVLWSTVFEPGYLTFEALENMLTECGAAVFIVTPDDTATVRGKSICVPRANVMLEFGLVAGRLGRHSVAICRYGGAELPSDLRGLTVIEMDPFEPSSAAESKSSDSLRHRAEEMLRLWSSRLLATAELIPRTDIVHGYTGRWGFDVWLDCWRGVKISELSYCQVSGWINLYVDSSGKTGSGDIFGRLTFKITSPESTQGPSQGELRFCHDISNLVCEPGGALTFTSRTFVIHKITASGQSLPELGNLDDLPEPWPFTWELRPTTAPRTLEGSLNADNPGATSGTVRAVKTIEHL
jgi:hypothetical protein